MVLQFFAECPTVFFAIFHISISDYQLLIEALSLCGFPHFLSSIFYDWPNEFCGHLLPPASRRPPFGGIFVINPRSRLHPSATPSRVSRRSSFPSSVRGLRSSTGTGFGRTGRGL